jgi:DNA-binding transcriptional LysR family regulator
MAAILQAHWTYGRSVPMDWDDLRIIAAIRDGVTFAGASTRLRMDETTVARRLTRLQKTLGVTLFTAVDGVRKPTAQCEAILDHVQEIARHVAQIGVLGKTTLGVTGRIRIATTNSLAEEILAPETAQFLLRNPGLALQFLVSGQNVNFARWEADLAVRLRKPDKGNFSITKLAEVRLYLFEPKEPMNAEGDPVICGYPDDLDETAESRFLKAQGLKARTRCVTDNLRVMRGLIQSHRAIGILPEHACGPLRADRGLNVTLLPHRLAVWLLIQNHLKRDPAARVVIEWMREMFNELARS